MALEAWTHARTQASPTRGKQAWAGVSTFRMGTPFPGLCSLSLSLFSLFSLPCPALPCPCRVVHTRSNLLGAQPTICNQSRWLAYNALLHRSIDSTEHLAAPGNPVAVGVTPDGRRDVIIAKWRGLSVPTSILLMYCVMYGEPVKTTGTLLPCTCRLFPIARRLFPS